jgi:hypothetical protein
MGGRVYEARDGYEERTRMTSSGPTGLLIANVVPMANAGFGSGFMKEFAFLSSLFPRPSSLLP